MNLRKNSEITLKRKSERKNKGQEHSAGAIIFYIDKALKEPVFLLLKYSNYWGFTKGGIEENETEEQAAKREIKEETNLDVLFISNFREEQRWFYRLEGKTINKHCVYFLAEIPEEQKARMRISSEHEGFVFAKPEETKKYIKIKENRKLLETAAKFIREYKKQEKLF